MFDLTAILNIPDLEPSEIQMGLSKGGYAKLIARGETKDGEKIDHSIIKADVKLSSVASNPSINSVVGKPLTKETLLSAKREAKGGKVVKGLDTKTGNLRSLSRSMNKEIAKHPDLVIDGKKYKIDPKYLDLRSDQSNSTPFYSGNADKTNSSGSLSGIYEKGKDGSYNSVESTSSRVDSFHPKMIKAVNEARRKQWESKWKTISPEDALMLTIKYSKGDNSKLAKDPTHSLFNDLAADNKAFEKRVYGDKKYQSEMAKKYGDKAKLWDVYTKEIIHKGLSPLTSKAKK